MHSFRRVLLVGSDNVWSIERVFSRHMNELGVETKIFACQNLFYDYYFASIWNKLKFRLGVSEIFKRINEELEKAVQEFDPEVIWVFKGMEVLPETVSRLVKNGRAVVNYNPDNPFIFSGRGSGNKNVTQSIGLFPSHFTYNLEIRKRLDAEFNVRTFLLPFGFDFHDDVLAECQKQQEVRRVCFLGNPDKGRANLILQIASQGIDVDVYGNYWQKFVQHDRISIFDPVYGLEFWKVLYKYRVQLNLMRPHNEDSHNMRSFEIPGIGGIQLAPDTTEHRLFFTPGKEIFLFRNVEECCMHIKALIGLSENEAHVIRQNARKRSQESGYSYRDRSVQVLSYFNEIIHG